MDIDFSHPQHVSFSVWIWARVEQLEPFPWGRNVVLGPWWFRFAVRFRGFSVDFW